ncbi:hypothetical protein C8R42DRAFT_640186 [Lentinula raphanica]|nr:hypothetical protein C8R42DRAFT_640186 [Lentinula raphanica]
MAEMTRFMKKISSDEMQLPLEDQAYIGIILQRGTASAQAQVLHSNVFLKRAADRNIVVNLPPDDEKAESDDGGNSDNDTNQSDSDDECVEVRPKVAKAKARMQRPVVEDVGDDDTAVAVRRYKPIPKRNGRTSVDNKEDEEEDELPADHKKNNKPTKKRLHSGPQVVKNRVHKNKARSPEHEQDEQSSHSRPRPRPRMIPPGTSRLATQRLVVLSDGNDDDVEDIEERPKKRARIEKKEQSKKRKRDV